MQRIKFIDQMAQGKLSRRKMLQSASAFGVGALMLPKLAQAEEVLTCLEWGGFDDQSYFTKIFRKYTNQSPGIYRRNRGRSDNRSIEILE